MKLLSSPAALRNRQPILEQLLRRLGPSGQALELSSGTGEHAVYFSGALPGWTYQPSDIDEGALATIEERRLAEGPPNLLPVRRVDVRDSEWSHVPLDLILSVNMVHISPWECTEALMRGAARHLRPQGLLFVYGPYRVEGEPTAPSNEEFDRSLRARDSRWGLRNLGEVQGVAQAQGLRFLERVAMPANNLSLWFERD